MRRAGTAQGVSSEEKESSKLGPEARESFSLAKNDSDSSPTSLSGVVIVFWLRLSRVISIAPEGEGWAMHDEQLMQSELF